MSLKRNSTVAQLLNNAYLTLWAWKMNGDENFVVIDNILFYERDFLTENAVHVIIEITMFTDFFKCCNYSQLLLAQTPSEQQDGVLNIRVRKSRNLFRSNICNLFLPGIWLLSVTVSCLVDESCYIPCWLPIIPHNYKLLFSSLGGWHRSCQYIWRCCFC